MPKEIKLEALSNWGNYPKIKTEKVSFTTSEEVVHALKSGKSTIARGMGRCYGDSALGDRVISTLKYNKFISFDETEGVISCQSGVTLDEVLQVAVPKGYFLPVTPGTKFVTVGGAVASDIHGKNHHIDGSFSRHVINLKLLDSDGAVHECSSDQNVELFQATCGGMGLTGIITEVTFKLKKIESAYISQKQVKAKNLDELLMLFEKHNQYTYSVAWVDCLATGKSFGRSILMLGEHAKEVELTKSQRKHKFSVHNPPKLNIPFQFPAFVLNPLSIKLFNMLYYGKNLKKEQNNITHYEGFFYPLDNINNWNRMYGKPGFLQYQFVLPMDKLDVLKEIMRLIAKKKKASFLTVLKVFGEQDDLMSFPMKGYTLALDFPNTPDMHHFLDELDQLVLNAKGRLYLTKDARMKPKTFSETYKNVDEFNRIVGRYNKSQRFNSHQSERLSILKN